MSLSAHGVQIAVEAAHAAGAIITEALGDGPPPLSSVRHKGEIDLVTRTDLASEACIVDILTRHTPDIPVLAEEGSSGEGASTRWIVDPLDGTTNFVHGFPAFAVVIALQHEGELISGCIYDPLRQHTYTAERGGGAMCNGQRLAVSRTTALPDALLLTGFPYDRWQQAEAYLKVVQAFMERCQGIRRAGAAALDLAHIAAGRADGMWEFGLSTWDIAAGKLLIEEAGGTVTDMCGAPLDLNRPRLLASNGLIQQQMEAVLAPLLS